MNFKVTGEMHYVIFLVVKRQRWTLRHPLNERIKYPEHFKITKSNYYIINLGKLKRFEMIVRRFLSDFISMSTPM